MEFAGQAGAFAVALVALEITKLTISKIGRNGNGSSSAKMLTRIDARTHELWEAHKPEGGRYRWWFPDEVVEQNGQILKELRRMNVHLETISNGKEKTG